MSRLVIYHVCAQLAIFCMMQHNSRSLFSSDENLQSQVSSVIYKILDFSDKNNFYNNNNNANNKDINFYLSLDQFLPMHKIQDSNIVYSVEIQILIFTSL